MTFLAKITSPKPLGAYQRQRLFELLDSVRTRRVIWVTGPPGAGKTTLVASYLAVRKIRALWYRLDDGDADPGTLFYYLNLAVIHAAPRYNKQLQAFTPEYQRGLPAFSRQYFRDLYDRLPRSFALVFDNYQSLALDARVHEVMQCALQEVPEHGNVIVISRTEPPEQLVGLRAADMLHVIEPEAMRLTHEESLDIIAKRSVVGLREDDCQRMAEQAQGWAAGIILMCESQRAGIAGACIPTVATLSALPDSGSRQVVFDYFATEILRHLDSETKEVLFTTALVPSITGPLAIALTGRPRAAEILHGLCSNNYFTLRDSQTEPVFQYHPLFREFLLTRAVKSFTPERLRQLRLHAATLLEQAGQIEDAADIYVICQASAELTRLLVKSADKLIKGGRSQTLLGWFSHVPPSLCDDNPWLIYWQAEAHLPFSPKKSQPLFERAFLLFQKQSNRSGMFLSWSGLVFAARFNPHLDIPQLARWVDVMEKILSADPTFPSEETEYQLALGMVRTIFWSNPRHPAYESWKQRALQHALSGIEPLRRASAVYTIAIYDLISGNFAQARLEIESVSQWRLVDMPPLVANLAYLSLAYYQRESGQLDACLRTVDEGLAASRLSGVHVWDFHLCGQGVWAALHRDEMDQADKLLRSMAEILNVHAPGEGSWYHSLAAACAMRCGELASARQHAETAISLTKGWNYFEATGRGMLAGVLCRIGEFDEAGRQVAKMREIGQEFLNDRLVLESFVLEATIRFAEGDESAADAVLQHALSIGRRHGLYLFSAWVAPSDGARLFAHALNANIEVDYVRSLIKRWKISPALPEIENWPWPLKIFTLGHFKVLVNDTPLVGGRKAPKQLFLLIKIIIALGGRDVPERQLADALWPDEEGDAARELLSTALHRLRKLLGDAEAIVLHEGRLTLDPLRVWVDACAFERLLGENTGGDKQDSANMMSKALALYQGNFLAGDDDMPWAVSMRERLRRKFIRHLSDVAKSLEQANSVDQAAELYARGIEIDNLAEEFYQGLISCRLRQGRVAEALSSYRGLKQILSITLGIAPSQATELLCRELHRG